MSLGLHRIAQTLESKPERHFLRQRLSDPLGNPIPRPLQPLGLRCREMPLSLFFKVHLDTLPLILSQLLSARIVELRLT